MAANLDSLEPAAAPEVAPTHRTLPFAFAKRHGVLIQELREGGAQAIYRTGAAAQSIAEVRRFAGVPVRFSEVDPETFDATLQAAYESGAAMTMVEGLNDDTDLSPSRSSFPSRRTSSTATTKRRSSGSSTLC